jgi:hypothetical protein
MANYSENFLCTALPVEIVGNKLRVAVLVSPRLISDDLANLEANLDNWPDARDWPSISPTWKVTIQQGANKVDFTSVTEVKPAPYDFAGWQQLFPGTSKVIPYQPADKSKAPIFSYPVKKVLDTAKDLHVKVLKGHRTEFPSLAALQGFDSFLQLKKAAKPGYAEEVTCTQLTGPSPDTDFGVADAFGLASTFHGVRPCSEQSPSLSIQLDGVSPSSQESGKPVKLSGENFPQGSIVLFDGLEATNVTVKADGTEITCTTPNHANGKVNVFVVYGDVFSNGAEFTYIPNNDPK